MDISCRASAVLVLTAGARGRRGDDLSDLAVVGACLCVPLCGASSRRNDQRGLNLHAVSKAWTIVHYNYPLIKLLEFSSSHGCKPTCRYWGLLMFGFGNSEPSFECFDRVLHFRLFMTHAYIRRIQKLGCEGVLTNWAIPNLASSVLRQFRDLFFDCKTGHGPVTLAR